jgi:hypothetical protein
MANDIITYMQQFILRVIIKKKKLSAKQFPTADAPIETFRCIRVAPNIGKCHRDERQKQ